MDEDHLHAPMINLYTRDLARAAAFYAEFGFVEVFAHRRQANLSISNSPSMGLPLE
jgi:catechol 2,3-dioxygenase-like lactoylglutathione lyase family enzyme